MTDLSRRDHFVLEMYKIFWQNVARTRVSLWAFIPSFAGAIWILFQNQELFEGFPISSSILVIIGINSISIFFSSIAFNLNLWFIRNMELISRLEYEMLDENDIDRLIPKSWVEKERSFFNWEFYCVFAYFFIIAGIVLSLGIIVKNNLGLYEISIIVIALVIGLLIEYFYVVYLKERYAKLLKVSNKPGKQTLKNNGGNQ